VGSARGSVLVELTVEKLIMFFKTLSHQFALFENETFLGEEDVEKSFKKLELV